MWRSVRVAVIAAVMLIASAIPAVAGTPQPISVGALSALWYRVLTLPNPENPFGIGGTAKTCINIAPLVISPFGPGGVPSCTVQRGTTLIVTPETTECSTFETPGKSSNDLRECAKDADAEVTEVGVAVDGHKVDLAEVYTVVLNIKLPADNIFGLPTGTRGQSVGHGWVAVVQPLSPGIHIINVKLTRANGATESNTTSIIIRRH